MEVKEPDITGDGGPQKAFLPFGSAAEGGTPADLYKKLAGYVNTNWCTPFPPTIDASVICSTTQEILL